MVKTQAGDIVSCRFCNSENLTVYKVSEYGEIWLECGDCGAIFQVTKESIGTQK